MSLWMGLALVLICWIPFLILFLYMLDVDLLTNPPKSHPRKTTPVTDKDIGMFSSLIQSKIALVGPCAQPSSW